MGNRTQQSVIMGLVIVAVIFVTGLPACFKAKTGPQKTWAQTSADKGALLYGTYCSFCHGENGEGYLSDQATALSNQNFLKSASDAYIIQAILRGRPGTAMSAWGKEYGGALSREDTLAIVSYIRKWQTEKSVQLNEIKITGNAQKGSKIYRAKCAFCHGKAGKGRNAVALNNPVFQQTASDGFIQYAIKYGRPKTPMPSYKGRLTSQKIDDVIAYIRTLKVEKRQKEAPKVSERNVAQKKPELAVLNPGAEAAEFSLIQNQYVSVAEVHKAYASGKSFMIVDARPHNDYLREHIKGALSIPFYDMGKMIGKLPKDIWIITYCACPHAMAKKAAHTLRAAGYDKVGALDEGFNAWKGNGYPTQSGNE